MECCVFTRGEFYIAEVESNCGTDLLCPDGKGSYRKLGNVSSCVLSPQNYSLGTVNEYNLTDGSCGLYSTLSVGIDLTINCVSKENLRMALHSDLDASSGSDTQDYCITSLSEGDFFPFKKYSADLISLVVKVKDVTTSTETILVKDIDFTVDSSGITFIASHSWSGQSRLLEFSYNYSAGNFSSFSLGSRKEFCKSLFFKGINYGEGNQEIFNAYIPRAILSPIDSIDLITQDNFMTLNLKGRAERVNGKWLMIYKQG